MNFHKIFKWKKNEDLLDFVKLGKECDLKGQELVVFPRDEFKKYNDMLHDKQNDR